MKGCGHAYLDLSVEEKSKREGIGLRVVEPGCYSDLLVIKGNPLDNIELLKDRNNMQLIMKDGHVWKNTLVSPSHAFYVPSERRYVPSSTL